MQLCIVCKKKSMQTTDSMRYICSIQTFFCCTESFAASANTYLPERLACCDMQILNSWTIISPDSKNSFSEMLQQYHSLPHSPETCTQQVKLCSTGHQHDSLHGHLVQNQQIFGNPDACSISQQLCLYNVVHADATPRVHVLSTFKRFQVWMDCWVHPPQRNLQERAVMLRVKNQIRSKGLLR